MKSEKSTLQTTIAGILAVGSALAMSNAMALPDAPKNWEKCAGVSKTGMNDCGAKDGSHQCAGQAKYDNADHEWVYVPEGTCTKLTGGMVVGIKPAK